MQITQYSSIQPFIDEIHLLMKDFSHTHKDIGYGRRWTFDNGLRFDLIDYKKQDTAILRVGRGAWLVKKYPILHSMFDEVMKVIAKFEVHGIQTLHDKHVVGLFSLLDKAPHNIGAFD